MGMRRQFSPHLKAEAVQFVIGAVQSPTVGGFEHADSTRRHPRLLSPRTRPSETEHLCRLTQSRVDCVYRRNYVGNKVPPTPPRNVWR